MKKRSAPVTDLRAHLISKGLVTPGQWTCLKCENVQSGEHHRFCPVGEAELATRRAARHKPGRVKR